MGINQVPKTEGSYVILSKLKKNEINFTCTLSKLNMKANRSIN